MRWGSTAARKVRLKTLQKTVGHADLTAAATSEVLSFDATSAGKNIVTMGVEMDLATAFSGGSVSALDVTLGTTADDDSIVSACDLASAAVDGHASAMTLGCAPFHGYEGATTFKLTFTATGDNVVNLTAGSMTCTIYYFELVA